MTLAFVDSGAWIAIMDPDDHWHGRARDFFRTLTQTRLLTSNYVVAETVTWLVHKGLGHRAPEFRRMVDVAERRRFLEIVWVGREPHDEAWDLLERYDNPHLSFFDCTSFVVARASEVDFVFGFDNDFRIAGFDLRP